MNQYELVCNNCNGIGTVNNSCCYLCLRTGTIIIVSEKEISSENKIISKSTVTKN